MPETARARLIAMGGRHARPCAALALVLVFSGACGPELAFAPVAPARLAELDADVAALVTEHSADVMRAPRDPRAHGTLGLVYHANGLYDEARRCYEHAAQLDTSGASWQLRHAMALRELGAVDEAWRVLEAAAPRCADSPAACQRLALARFERGDLDGAATVLAASLARVRARAELLAALAQVENARERWPAAEKSAREALALDAKFAFAHHQLGLALRGRGLAEEAERELALGLNARMRWIPDEFETEIARYRVNYVAQFERAARLVAAQKFTEALALYERLALTRGSDPVLLTNLGACQLDCGRTDAAVATLARAVELAPDSLNAHVGLARARAKAGDAAGSYSAWTRAAECAPGNTSLFLPLADAAARAGRLDDARTWCLRALKADPAQLDARINLGHVALRRNDRVELAQVLAELQQIAPSDERVLALQRAAAEKR